MEKKINIAELLKDCPQGMELYSTMYDNLYFDSLNADYCGTINCYTLIAGTKTSISFTKYGTFNDHMGAKCVIFPKGKTTWEGFVPPCKFKDGDIVFTTLGNIAIIRKPIGGELFSVYGIMVGNCFYKDETVKGVVERHATEEEKQKLFNAIKENGYKWNAETKTFEELTEQKFDITTFKPYQKVLFRQSEDCIWLNSFFGFYDKNAKTHPFICCNGFAFKYCIPYKGNQHLLGTTIDCDEFYKTWE
jgi:hypothetical protein